MEKSDSLAQIKNLTSSGESLTLENRDVPGALVRSYFRENVDETSSERR